MPGNTVTVTLPYSRTVVIQAFANARYAQRVSVQPQGDRATVWTGTGFYSTPLGSMMITTPSGSGAGFPVTITIDHSSDGGTTWSGSQVDSVRCEILYYATEIVASEDAGDGTWNDATVYLSWSQAPQSTRQPSRTHHHLQATVSSYRGRA